MCCELLINVHKLIVLKFVKVTDVKINFTTIAHSYLKILESSTLRVELSCVEAAITCLHIQNKAAITFLHYIFIILTVLLNITYKIQCQERKETHPRLV